MIQLSENIIAIEVPKDAITPIWVGRKVSQDKYLFWMSPSGIDSKTLGADSFSLIGITPLSEGQWKEVVGSHTSSENVYCNMTPYQVPVSPKDRWNDLQRHKGLDINKKYAIIKIEK